MRYRRYRVVSLTALLCLGPVATGGAHHSAAMFDTDREVVIEGVVSRYDWRNPHVYMVVETIGAGGAVIAQQIEAGAPSVLLPLGLTAGSLIVGERVTIRANPNKHGADRIALGRSLTKEDGTDLPLNIAARNVRERPDARASSLAGTWFAPLGPFRAFRAATSDSWQLTDKGRRAMGAYDIADASYADCIPVTAPTLMIYPVTTTVEIAPDAVVFDVDWMSSRRVVHTDGRGHPDGGEPTLHGDSVGRWEGETLVVDTVLYAEHKEGLTLGVPSGTGKHTIERFSLSDDGRYMNYEVVVEDPEYLLEPIRHSSQLEYRPDLEPTGLACDLEAARRYLTNE